LKENIERKKERKKERRERRQNHQGKNKQMATSELQMK
jgi:hypothetical protein